VHLAVFCIIKALGTAGDHDVHACLCAIERDACSAGKSEHSEKQIGQMEESVGLDDGGAATAVALQVNVCKLTC